MREGAAVIECTHVDLPGGCRKPAVVEGYFWRRAWDPNSYNPRYCDLHNSYNGANNPIHSEAAQWRFLPLLQPSKATDEEVLMVEMMCHGLASLGVPR